jgi:hypothetical protein
MEHGVHSSKLTNQQPAIKMFILNSLTLYETIELPIVNEKLP